METKDINVDRAAKLDTATLSDALDKLGIRGQCLAIKPLLHSFRLTGRAFTLLYCPMANGGTVGDFIDDVPTGSVVVIDNHGREDATVWGDILTMCARQRGIAGTVIDGACRDTALAIQMDYPIFSRSYSMRTGKDRVQLEAVNRLIEIGNARVAPGDIMRGDSDGIVAIPAAHEAEILDMAEKIQAAEEKIRASVAAGTRLAEARREQGYHELQRGHGRQ
jgi:regulator of RNase E activity RraA